MKQKEIEEIISSSVKGMERNKKTTQVTYKKRGRKGVYKKGSLGVR